MRIALLAFLMLFAAPAARAAPSLFRKLLDDTATRKPMKEGLKILDAYFKMDRDSTKPGKPGASARRKREQALDRFDTWLSRTEGTLKVDLRGREDTVLEMLDQSRSRYLSKRGKKGAIDYIKVENARGIKRFEYALLLPKAYDMKGNVKVPCVVSLHGRVINPKHPAFRGKDFAERGRQVIWNYWLKSPSVQDVLVIAPTGNANGFRFIDTEHYDDLQTMYRALGEALTNYRVDWDRIFIEIQGAALRVACEQRGLFAGYILRDRIDDRHRPFLPEEQRFMLRNLNGIPLCYVADDANWAKVGKPMSEALHKAYLAAGVPGNLLVLRDKRDANQALKGDPEKIHQFVMQHRRDRSRPKFTWRFFNSDMTNPTPVSIPGANFFYDLDEASRNAPLAAKAGSLSFDVKREGEGDNAYNLIDITITEAESLRVYLHDGIVDLDLPVSVRVNGRIVVDKKVLKRNWRFFWGKVLPRRFFMLPYLAQLSCKFPPKPQFVAPSKKKPEKKPDPGAGKAPAKTEAPGEAGK